MKVAFSRWRGRGSNVHVLGSGGGGTASRTDMKTEPHAERRAEGGVRCAGVSV